VCRERDGFAVGFCIEHGTSLDTKRKRRVAGASWSGSWICGAVGCDDLVKCTRILVYDMIYRLSEFLSNSHFGLDSRSSLAKNTISAHALIDARTPGTFEAIVSLSPQLSRHGYNTHRGIGGLELSPFETSKGSQYCPWPLKLHHHVSRRRTRRTS
jgi:hypothetical protein